MITHGPPGFYGKIQAQGDFVRSGVADPMVQRLVRWLEEGSEGCYRASAALPATPAALVFRPSGERRAVLCALRGSRDKVGRSFPLTLFVTLDGPELAAAWPALPAAYRPLLDAMGGVLADAEQLTLAALTDRVRALAPPAGGALAAEAARARAELEPLLLETAAPPLGGPAGPRGYALNTLRTACTPLRGREPTRAETVLDCPGTGDADRHLWLSLARQALGWAAPPSFAWRTGGRLLLSLGPPPATLLAALAEPPRDGSKVWPLTTAQPAAQEAAARALGPVAAQLNQPGLTVGGLLAAMAPPR